MIGPKNSESTKPWMEKNAYLIGLIGLTSCLSRKARVRFTMRKIKFKNSFNFCQPIIESRFVLSDRSGTYIWKFEKICILFQISLKKWQCGLHKLHALFGFFSPTKYYFDDINIQKTTFFIFLLFVVWII